MNFIDDVRISWKAKGIMMFLLESGKDEFTIYDICSIGKEKIDSIQNGLKELIKYEYITEDKGLSKTDGFIYVIGNSYGDYKIGKTRDMEKRLKGYRTAMPYEPVIVKVKKVENVDQYEKELHKRYSEKNINKEWFRLDENDLTELKSL